MNSAAFDPDGEALACSYASGEPHDDPSHIGS